MGFDGMKHFLRGILIPSKNALQPYRGATDRYKRLLSNKLSQGMSHALQRLQVLRCCLDLLQGWGQV